jgi:general secretion pathway protein G
LPAHWALLLNKLAGATISCSMVVGPPARVCAAWRERPRGFTLLELMMALIVAGIVTTVAVSGYRAYASRAQTAAAIGGISQLALEIARFELNNNRLPTSLAEIGRDTLLDPWGHSYRYMDFTGVPGNGHKRKDGNLVPLNSDYDLYSVGADGATQSSLRPRVSHDDIIRANNGRFIGLGEDY